MDLFWRLPRPILEARRRPSRCSTSAGAASAPGRRRKPSSRGGDVAAVEKILARAVQSFVRENEARAAPAWNGRRREPLPPDYEDTLARYHAWKLEQERARLSAVQDRALDELARLERAILDDPVYLSGFAAGVAWARDWSPGGCATLSPHGPSSSPPAPPEAHSAERDRPVWRRGWEDGRDLAAALAVMRAALDCLAELPPP
jgi:hypothetical protein